MPGIFFLLIMYYPVIQWKLLMALIIIFQSLEKIKLQKFVSTNDFLKYMPVNATRDFSFHDACVWEIKRLFGHCVIAARVLMDCLL